MSCKGRVKQWKEERKNDFMPGFTIRLKDTPQRKITYQFLFPYDKIPKGGGNWGPIQNSYPRSLSYLPNDTYRAPKECNSNPRCIIEKNQERLGVFYQPYHPNYPYEPYSIDTYYDLLPRDKWDRRC